MLVLCEPPEARSGTGNVAANVRYDTVRIISLCAKDLRRAHDWQFERSCDSHRRSRRRRRRYATGNQ